MGAKISIDKHVSNIEDILQMPPGYFDKIKFESKISQDITHHLKVSIIYSFLQIHHKCEYIDLEILQ